MIFINFGNSCRILVFLCNLFSLKIIMNDPRFAKSFSEAYILRDICFLEKLLQLCGKRAHNL